MNVNSKDVLQVYRGGMFVKVSSRMGVHLNRLLFF